MKRNLDNHATAAGLKAARSVSVDRRGFTLIELLTVMAVVGVIAGLVLGLAANAATAGKRRRIQAQMQELVTAIESYKSKLGFYPPDNVVNRVTGAVNPALNPLFYELTGTVFTNSTFRTINADDVVNATAVKTIFNLDGFLNSSDNRAEVKNFLPNLKASQFKEVSENPTIEVLAVPVDGPGDLFNAASGKRVNPWRYVASNPTNNPNSFDLWAEVTIGGKVVIIGNWR